MAPLASVYRTRSPQHLRLQDRAGFVNAEGTICRQVLNLAPRRIGHMSPGGDVYAGDARCQRVGRVDRDGNIYRSNRADAIGRVSAGRLTHDPALVYDQANKQIGCFEPPALNLQLMAGAAFLLLLLRR